MNAHRILESFVARIWLEHEPNGEPTWRGHIQHVQGKQKAYFQSLEQMRAFLEEISGVPGPATDCKGDGRQAGRGGDEEFD